MIFFPLPNTPRPRQRSASDGSQKLGATVSLRSEGAVDSTQPRDESSGSRFLFLWWSERFEQSAEHSLRNWQEWLLHPLQLYGISEAEWNA
jgi:hypothetical protein